MKRMIINYEVGSKPGPCKTGPQVSRLNGYGHFLLLSLPSPPEGSFLYLLDMRLGKPQNRYEHSSEER